MVHGRTPGSQPGLVRGLVVIAAAAVAAILLALLLPFGPELGVPGPSPGPGVPSPAGGTMDPGRGVDPTPGEAPRTAELDVALRIVDEISRTPLPGALVRTGGAELRADPEGRVSVRTESRNRLALVVSAPGHQARWIEATPAVEPTEVLVTLRPTALVSGLFRIRGRVVTDAGDPASGAEVRAMQPNWFLPVPVRPDATFNLTVPSPPMGVTIVAEHPEQGRAHRSLSLIGDPVTRGKELVLRLSHGVEVPVEIAMGGGAAEGGFRLTVTEEGTPDPGSAAGAPVRSIRSGDLVRVLPGSWRFGLEPADGGGPVAEDVCLTCDGESVRRRFLEPGGPFSTRSFDVRYRPVSRLRFELFGTGLRVRVTCGGRPVPDLAVTLEIGADVDPWLGRWRLRLLKGKYGEQRASTWRAGRRAPPSRSRTERTDADGVVGFPVPFAYPALLHVRGDGIHDQFFPVEAPAPGNLLEVEVDRCGWIEVLFPEWLDSVVIHRTGTERAIRAARGEPMVQVEPGEYEIVRLGWGAAGEPREERLLGPLVVATGERVEADLAGLTAARRVTVAFPAPPGAGAVLCRGRVLGPEEERAVVGGRVELRLNRWTGIARLEFVWAEDGGAVHRHRVELPGGLLAVDDPDAVVRADFRSAALHLRIRNDSGSPRLLTLSSRRPAGENATSHACSVVVPAGTSDLSLEGLPEGEHQLHADDPAVRFSPEKLTVPPAGSAQTTVVLTTSRVRFHLTLAMDGKPDASCQEVLFLLEGPLESPDAKPGHGKMKALGPARDFEMNGLEPGTYRATVFLQRYREGPPGTPAVRLVRKLGEVVVRPGDQRIELRDEGE